MCGGHKNHGVDSDGVLVEAALHPQPMFCLADIYRVARRAFIEHVVLYFEICPNEVV